MSTVTTNDVFVKKTNSKNTDWSFKNDCFLILRLTFTVTEKQQLEVLIADIYYVLKNL